MSLVAICAAYLQSCDRERHLAPHTLAAYRQDLAEFCRFFQGRLLAEISSEDLLAYSGYLEKVRGLAPATIKRRLACIRAMFARLVRQRKMDSDPFRGVEIRIRLPTRLPRCLGAAETRALLQTARAACPTTRLATELLIATGVRISELSAIRLCDINLEQRVIKVFGKGSRERQVFLIGEGLTTLLECYLERLHGSSVPDARLLVNRCGAPASAACLRGRIKALARTASLLRHVTPHMLRHTAATALIEAGVDIRFVQRLLGHQTIATTQIYAHVSDRALKAAISSANVLDRLGENAGPAMAA